MHVLDNMDRYECAWGWQIAKILLGQDEMLGMVVLVLACAKVNRLYHQTRRKHSVFYR